MDPNFFLQNALANQQAGGQVKRQQMQNPRMMMPYGQQQQQHASPGMANAAMAYSSPYNPAASPMNSYATSVPQANNPVFSAAAFGSVDPQLMGGMNPVFNQNLQSMMSPDGTMMANTPYNQAPQQSQSPFSQPAYLAGQNGNGMNQQSMAARYQQYANTPAQIQAQMQQLQQNAGKFKNGQQMGMAAAATSPFMMQQQQTANMMNAQQQAKQSPSQSPSMNHANYTNAGNASPAMSNSPMIGGQNFGNVMSNNANSSANSSPAKTFAMANQPNSANASPQMHRNVAQGSQRFSPYSKGSFPGPNTHAGLSPQQIQAMQQQHFQRQQALQQSQQQSQMVGGGGTPQQLSAGAGQSQMNQPTRMQAQQQPDYAQMAQANMKASEDKPSPEKLWSEHLQSQKPIPMALPPSIAQQARARTASQSSLDTTQVVTPSATPSMSAAEPHLSTNNSTPQQLHESPQAIDTRVAMQGSPSQGIKTNDNEATTQSPASAGHDKNFTYIPKTRNVDTYGGVDLKYFDRYEIRPMLPTIGELGIVDIHAITMSLKSEMKLEVSNALNILTVLTSNRSVVLSMRHCDDLLDVLLDYLEQDLMGVNSRYDTQPSKEDKLSMVSEKDRTYGQLFEMSLDEMKSLIPSLEKTTSDVWLSYRERCLCIINILRNLSFMPENQEYFGRHKRLTDILAYVLASDISMDENGQHEDTMSQTNGNDHLDRPAWYVGIRHMDTLDYRKSALLIFSNIVVFLKLSSASSALIFIKLTDDFLSNGPDTYFSQIAVETWAKVSVSYDNRNVFAALSLTSAIENKNTEVVQHDDAFTHLENIWEELGSIIRKDFFTSDGRVIANMKAHQLALLEMAVMGLYNIMVIAKEETLRARLLVRDRGIGMVIVKLCVSLAEYGTQHFGVVCRRGLELVRGLITGGDGLRRKTEDTRQRDNAENPETSPQLGTEVTSRIASKLEIDAYVINQLLMYAMLNPATDPDTTRELWDIQSILEEEA
ncbi:hypothetical protein BC943DRAFT_317352 [Umbelopsis sp. AD052]|nr:hypothetical protein BC943DRAFT_317352 [Umbelopsis sp. AD052]